MKQVQILGTPQKAEFPDEMSDEEVRDVLRQQTYSRSGLVPKARLDQFQQAQKPEQRIENVEPRFVDRVSDAVGGALFNWGVINDKNRAHQTAETLSFAGEIAPVLGEAQAMQDFDRAINEDRTLDAHLYAMGMGLPIVGKHASKLAIQSKDAIIGQLDKVTGDLPIIDPRDLIGKKIVPTLADMTDAGRMYDGIDAAEVMPIELQGGPKFPLLESYNQNNVVWAVNSKGQQTELQKGDIIAVSAMMNNSHESNATVNQAYQATLDAYLRDGRIPPENIQQIDQLIATKFDGAPSISDTDAYHDWVEGLTFEQRKKLLVPLYNSPAMNKLGAPNFGRILDETIDKDYAGHNKGDAMLLIEVDKTPDSRIELGTGGTKKHKSYKYGVKGRVIGQFAKPVGFKTLYPDFMEKRALETENRAGDYRSFQLSTPAQEMTPELADRIGSEGFKSVTSPRQAELTDNLLRNNWSSSEKSVKDRGVSTDRFVAAIRRNSAAPTLTKYDDTPDAYREFKRNVKSGKIKLFQLDDYRKNTNNNNNMSEVYFGIEKDYNYNDAYGVDLEAAGLSPNEKAIVGVVNNELGAKGVAGTSVMLKAIEEGGTVLDAFAVKSKRFPDGFLPSLYGEFGFKTRATVPFDESYYSAAELADLKKVWGKSGWDESQGYPDIHVMKWEGDDNARATIHDEWLNAVRAGDESGFIGRGTEQSHTSAREALSKSRSAGGGQARAGSNAGGNSGDLRDSNRTPLASKFAAVAREVDEMSTADRSNLGLPIQRTLESQR